MACKAGTLNGAVLAGEQKKTKVSSIKVDTMKKYKMGGEKSNKWLLKTVKSPTKSKENNREILM